VAPPDFAWYRLNETSGTVAHDSTNNHYDIGLSNVTWGLGASFSIPTGDSPSGGSTPVASGMRQAPISFTAWLAPSARSDETSNSYSITPFPPSAVSGDVPGEYGFGMGLSVWTDGTAGSALAFENVGYTFLDVGGAQFLSGSEYFVTATIGSSSAQVYVDGLLVGQATPTTPGSSEQATLSLGFHNTDTSYGTKRFYSGRMRDVRIYKRVLSATEVATLYANGPSP
jgi:concanavalin A-like lectin/glucanase superfamily protein